jgi:hypothetical protein
LVKLQGDFFALQREPWLWTPKSIDQEFAQDQLYQILFYFGESSLIQSSCRSFIRVIVPYERGYETSGSPLRFMLRRSSLVLPGNRCLQNVRNDNSNNKALKKSRPQYISAQKIFLMKLPDNFQMSEHSRPCRFHIRNYYDLYVLSVKIQSSGYTFYRPPFWLVSGFSAITLLEPDKTIFKIPRKVKFTGQNGNRL